MNLMELSFLIPGVCDFILQHLLQLPLQQSLAEYLIRTTHKLDEKGQESFSNRVDSGTIQIYQKRVLDSMLPETRNKGDVREEQVENLRKLLQEGIVTPNLTKLNYKYHLQVFLLVYICLFCIEKAYKFDC